MGSFIVDTEASKVTSKGSTQTVSGFIKIFQIISSLLTTIEKTFSVFILRFESSTTISRSYSLFWSIVNSKTLSSKEIIASQSIITFLLELLVSGVTLVNFICRTVGISLTVIIFSFKNVFPESHIILKLGELGVLYKIS